MKSAQTILLVTSFQTFLNTFDYILRPRRTFKPKKVITVEIGLYAKARLAALTFRCRVFSVVGRTS